MYVCMKIFYNCVPRFMLPCKQESRETIIKYTIFPLIPLITWRCLSYACDKCQIICPTKICVETLKIPSLQNKRWNYQRSAKSAGIFIGHYQHWSKRWKYQRLFNDGIFSVIEPMVISSFMVKLWRNAETIRVYGTLELSALNNGGISTGKFWDAEISSVPSFFPKKTHFSFVFLKNLRNAEKYKI